MASHHLRKATIEDAPALSVVGAATFIETYAHMVSKADMITHCTVQHSAEHYRTRMTADRTVCWILEHEGTHAPIGYSLLCPPELPVDHHSDDLELKRIYILSKFQGGGTGRALVTAAATEAQSRGATQLLLGTNKDNPVVGFYHHLGFKIIGERTFTVGETDYADYVMALAL